MMMMIKTLNLTVDILVALSLWCAAVAMTVSILHLVMAGGSTAWRLMQF